MIGKGAFNLVQRRSKEGDRFVSYWPEFGRFYLGQEIIAWENIDPESVVSSGTRFWFVVDSETIWGNRRMKGWVERNAELIDVKYLRTPGDFYLRIYLYDPARDLLPGQTNTEK